MRVNRTDWRDGSLIWRSTDAYLTVEYILILVMPHAAAMTAALLAIRLRRPRPTLPMKLRPFRLTDAMIIFVAAAGFSVNRLNWLGFLERWRQPLDPHDSIEHVLDLVTPHLAAATIAVLVMRMWSPRPPFSRFARQPGTVACIVALAVVLVIACWVGITTATGRVLEFSEHVVRLGGHGKEASVGYPIYPFSGRFLFAYGDRIGFAVAGAWFSL
jgi:hypothetical protein